MTEACMREVKDLFFRVKQFYYGSAERTEISLAVSVGEVADYVGALKAASTACLAEEKDKEKDDAPHMLARMLDLVAEALQDRNYRLAGDLADVGIQLMGVYSFPYISRKRFVKTALLPLREKHGEELLLEEEKLLLSRPDGRVALRPSFRSPREEGHYVSEHADDSFRRAHPILYVAFMVLGALVFFGAVAGYTALTTAVFGLSGGFVLLGLLGSVLFGMGLFRLLMTFIRQYMGHGVTLFLLVTGGALMGISWLLL
ncbi:MAG: hypothetical protein J6R89_04360 [Clostridia bacterium]|nr:hypothetical protein [Clostridia bacterium]